MLNTVEYRYFIKGACEAGSIHANESGREKDAERIKNPERVSPGHVSGELVLLAHRAAHSLSSISLALIKGNKPHCILIGGSRVFHFIKASVEVFRVTLKDFFSVRLAQFELSDYHRAVGNVQLPLI